MHKRCAWYYLKSSLNIVWLFCTAINVLVYMYVYVHLHIHLQCNMHMGPRPQIAIKIIIIIIIYIRHSCFHFECKDPNAWHFHTLFTTTTPVSLSVYINLCTLWHCEQACDAAMWQCAWYNRLNRCVSSIEC